MKLSSALAILTFGAVAPVTEARAKVNGQFCKDNIYSSAGVQCIIKKTGAKVLWPSAAMQLDIMESDSWKKGGSHECPGGHAKHRKRHPNASGEPAGTSAAPSPARELSVGPRRQLALHARGLANSGKHDNAAKGIYTAWAISYGASSTVKANIWALVSVEDDGAYLRICGFDIDLKKNGFSKCECYYET